MDLAPDFDEFIGSLIAHGVEFIVVGAYALAFHGAPRFTGDLDILVRPTLDNAARLLTALEAFGFPVTDLTPKTIVDRLYMETARALKMPDVIERLAIQGGNELVGNTPEQFAALIKAEIIQYAKIIKQANIKLE